MTPRQYPLQPPAVLFADRSARTVGPTSTVESIALALRLGATGISTNAWLTLAGVVVAHRDPGFGTLRKKRFAQVGSEALPPDVATLAKVHAHLGVDVPLRVSAPTAVIATAVLEHAIEIGADHRLVLTAPSWPILAELRQSRSTAALLVHQTTPAGLDGSPELHAAALRDAGIDGVAMAHDHWSGGTVALMHRFRRVCIGLDAEHERMIERLLHIGIDAVVSDHPERLHDASAPYR